MKIRKTKKITALPTMIPMILIILIAMICMSLLTACNSDPVQESGGEDTNEQQNDSGGAVDSIEEKQEEARIEPDLPDGVDLDGYVFTFLTHQQNSDDWYQPEPREIVAEEETGAPINDAVFRRNAVLKEKYNFELAMITNTDEVAVLRRAVSAGDDIYDAAIFFNNHAPNAVSNNLLVDIDQLPYIDWDKPWWDPAIKGMSVMGKNFLLAGDLLILDNEATNALIFNKDLLRDLGHGLPYEMVTSGKWTLDAMEALMKDAAFDINGDGQMTPLEDRWGFVTYDDALHAFLIGGGGSLAEKDDRDVPFMNFTSDRNLTIFERSMDIMLSDYTMNIQRDLDSGGDGNPIWTGAMHTVFGENRALFMWVRMRVVEKFRGMESGFGIVPIPKFDENQENYLSIVNPWTGVMLGVPMSAGDLSRTSIILEAISAESRYTIQPAYYDIVLQRQFTRDEESEEMLDIIFSTRVYDIGAVYNFATVFGDYIQHARNNNRGITTYYERRGPVMQGEIDKLIARIEDMD
jgi:hypothetical protein